MVLLSMTPGIVRALQGVMDIHRDEIVKLQEPHEPALTNPQVGCPISHRQLIGLSKLLKKHVSMYSDSSDSDSNAALPITLAALLLNTTVFTPPSPPKPTKSPEYQALMARLRAEEEARNYERMLHPPPTRETFNQRFPKAAQPFSLGANVPSDEDEDLSYEEVHRQIILIINILISIVCVAVFIWVAARHWSVGKRLGLSMGGALAIAVAEVAVYGGYVRKVREAKNREKKKPEIKEIVKSWALEKGRETEGVVLGGREKEVDGMRFRKGKHR